METNVCHAFPSKHVKRSNTCWFLCLFGKGPFCKLMAESDSETVKNWCFGLVQWVGLTTNP